MSVMASGMRESLVDGDRVERQGRERGPRRSADVVESHSEEVTEKACSHSLGAVCLLGATSAELLRVKRHKFPDAHRRPAGHPLHAVRLPVITTRPVQLAHRQKMPRQMLRHT